MNQEIDIKKELEELKTRLEKGEKVDEREILASAMEVMNRMLETVLKQEEYLSGYRNTLVGCRESLWKLQQEKIDILKKIEEEKEKAKTEREKTGRGTVWLSLFFFGTLLFSMITMIRMWSK